MAVGNAHGLDLINGDPERVGEDLPWLKLSSAFWCMIFSTKNREPLITPEIEPELFAYIGGILKNNESRLLDAGGTFDHAHLLISQSKNIALSSLMKDVRKTALHG